MPSSDKKLAFSVKITSSRELLNKGTNVASMSQGTSLQPKDKGPAEDPIKAVGTKRLHTDAPSSPVYHNVYVRRKVETEHSKVNSSQELKGNGRDKTKEQEEQQNVESEHSKVNSSQELKANGREKTKEQKQQQNMETENSKVNSSQELKDNGSEKTKEQEERLVQHYQVNKPEVPPPIAKSGIKELVGQQRVQHGQVNKPEVPPPIAKSGIKELTGEQTVQHGQVNKPEVPPPIAKSGINELAGEETVQHDQVNKPEVRPLIAESGIEEKKEWQTVQHDHVNKPEVAPLVAEFGTKEEDEQQMMQHDQVNKPEVAPPVAESGTKEEEPQTMQHEQINKPEVAPPIAESQGLVSSQMASSIAESVGLVPSESPKKTNAESIPENEPPVASANEPVVTPGTTVHGDIHRSSNQNTYWSERYDRLQTYLENCDRSSQEGYMRMLRSLSAAGRSMHAIELEKRAIHLLVEEGRELQRMKSLNVLGKSPPNGSSKQAPLQR